MREGEFSFNPEPQQQKFTENAGQPLEGEYLLMEDETATSEAPRSEIDWDRKARRAIGESILGSTPEATTIFDHWDNSPEGKQDYNDFMALELMRDSLTLGSETADDPDLRMSPEEIREIVESERQRLNEERKKKTAAAVSSSKPVPLTPKSNPLFLPSSSLEADTTSPNKADL